MKRTTIMLPEQLKLKVEQRAKEKGISMAEFMRESIKKNIASEDKLDILFSDREYFFADTETDLAENHDDYLY